MRTLTEKYNGVLKGLFSKDQFLRDARMEQSHFITQHNSYGDAVNILLNKGLISEAMSDQGKDKIIKSATQNGDKSYSVTYEDGTTAKIAVSHDDWDDIHGKYGSLSEVEEEITEKMDNPDHTAAAIPLEDVSIEEGPAKNNPKIEKLVAGINDLIAQAVDDVGDPIGVVDSSGTWPEPYVYSPIEYRNGHLKITSRSVYKSTPEVETILSKHMEYDGIDTLRLIMRMYKKAIKQAGRMSSQDIEEKKLTDAEKAGKEKIVKSLAKAGMSKKDPKTYAIATTQAKELYEGFEEVNVAYSDILEVYKKHYTQLANMNEDDAYALHELLKSYFNRLFEGTISEADVNVKRNDKLEHIPSGAVLSVSISTPTRISGFLTVGGTIKGKEFRRDDLILVRPVEVGAVWKKLPSEEPEIKYHNMTESKEEGYESPKPELPLDVLHHGIRFELDKKEIGNTPTKEEYLKAYKAVTKNLEKDLLHYKREEGAEDAPVSKSDEMVKVKLKESFKNIIRNILSENESDKKAFNLNGKVI
jgi:hypothetical protein